MDHFRMTFHYPGRRLWMPQFGCGRQHGHHVYGGRPISNWDSREIAIYDQPFVDRDFAPSLGLLSMPIISSRVKELFHSMFPDALQFLPFRFQMDDGTGEVLGYYCLHVLTVCDCVSIEHSGNLLKHQIMLSRERLKNVDIVFDTGMMDYVVTAKVVQAVNSAKFTGFAFEPVKLI